MPSDPDQSDPTLPGKPVPAGNAPPPVAQHRSVYRFLSPPQGPDELGRLGTYRVLRLLGAGGMGYVFEAEDPALRRRVAIKVLRPDLADPGDRERFLREARAAAAVDSDHVVTIYHVADSDVPYIVMQFLEGETLQSRIEKRPPVTLRQALEIGRQTAEGLAAAHAKGLIHRDIKPANLWLETRGESPKAAKATDWDANDPAAEMSLDSSAPHPSPVPRVKILDFGLARRRTGEVSLTSTGFIVGTPNFMAPEQAAGGDIDHRADLFSLGCVLYAMLVGELPFQGSSAMAVMMALANKTPPPVNAANASIPQGVADLVSRLLEKDPAQRPESAREVVAAIEQFLGTLSGNVPLPSPSARHAHVQPGGETLVPGRSDTLPPTPTPVQQPAPPASAVVSAPRRWKARATWGVVGLVIVAAAGFGLPALFRDEKPGAAPAPGPIPEPVPAEPIVVGILHSQSGTMAVSEKPVIDSTLMAIDELNASGGVLGRPVKAVVADGKSDPDEFARQAALLIGQEKAVALFGCWTSASRRAVREVLQQKNDGVLFYPVQYEGLGDSPRIVYLGPAPNQQIIPAVEYLTRPVADGGLGKNRIFLVGSDYLFPRVAHEIIRDQIAMKKNDGVEVVGERFLPLGSDDATLVVAQIKRAEPDAIVNTLNGGTNFHFFRELRKDGFTPGTLPTLSLSITENEVGGLDPAAMAGNYLAASYFQTIDRPESREFLRKLRERNGPAQVATDPMAAAYTGVWVWAKAVEKAGSADANAVLKAVRGLQFDGVRARVTVDAVNLHTWLPARLGRIRPDGLVDLVPNAGSDRPLRPEPFPTTRTVAQWHQFLQSLQFKWNGRWQPPDAK